MSSPIILGGSGNPEYASGVTPSGLIFAARTDKGIGYDLENQDRIVIAADNDFFAVIDGMGGYNGGEAAAQLIAEELTINPRNPQQCFVNAQVKMKKLFTGSLAKAGACVSTLSIHPATKEWTGFHAGDVKRLIISRKTLRLHDKFLARVRRLLGKNAPTQENLIVTDESVDHDVLQYMRPGTVLSGRFRNSVTKSIRRETSDVERKTGFLLPGARALLYSDGISDNIPAVRMLCEAVGKSVSELLDDIWKITTDKMENYDEIRAESEPMKCDNRAFVGIFNPDVSNILHS